MKKFEFEEFFYETMKSMKFEQRGKFVTVLCEQFFNGKNAVSDDAIVNGAASMAIAYVNKQSEPTDDWEKRKAQSKEVLDYVKENELIICVKAGLSEEQKQEIYQNLSHIPQEVIDSTLEWIKTKYRDNYYFN